MVELCQRLVHIIITMQLALLPALVNDVLQSGGERHFGLVLDIIHQLAYGIDVGAAVHCPQVPLPQLGGRKLHAAPHGVAVRIGQTESQVHNLDIAADLRQHHILRTDVHICHIGPVQHSDALEQLAEHLLEIPALSEVFRLQGQFLLQGLAVDILHQDEDTIGILAHLQIAHHMAVVHSAAHLELLLEQGPVAMVRLLLRT